MVWGGVIVNSGLFQNAPGGKGMTLSRTVELKLEWTQFERACWDPGHSNASPRVATAPTIIQMLQLGRSPV